MSEKNPSGAIHPTVFLVLWFAIGFGPHEIAPLEFTGPGFLDTLKTGVVVIGMACSPGPRSSSDDTAPHWSTGTRRTSW